jgi:hypothetical protein
MSVRFLRAEDLTARLTALGARSDTTSPPVAGLTHTFPFNFQPGIVSLHPDSMIYWAPRDRFYGRSIVLSADHVGIGLISLDGSLDPTLVDVRPPRCNVWTDTWDYLPGAPVTPGFLIPGQLRPYVASGNRNGLGGLYPFDLDSLEQPLDVDVEPLYPIDPPSYLGLEFFQVGGFQAVDLIYTPGDWASVYFGLIFEGLTAGVPGETALSAPGSYPAGLYLTLLRERFVSGDIRAARLGWVDLATNRLVGFSVLPATLEPAAYVPGQEALENLAFPKQFIPDPDSTLAQPKGELLLCSRDPAAAIFPVATNEFARPPLRFVDFNPLGVRSQPGVPQRVHGRSRFFTRLRVPAAPPFDLPDPDEGPVNTTELGVVWDSKRRRFAVFAENDLIAGSVTIYRSVGLYSRAVLPDTLSVPVPLGPAKAPGTVGVRVVVSGDLGEPVQGARVRWQLRRVSTFGELLTIAGGIGTTSTLAHVPVQDVQLTGNGAALAAGVDYTLSASTGVVTWLVSQVGKTVLARYAHPTTPVSPAHGTLLGAQSTTNALGLAETQVRYDEDAELVGALDHVSAELA